jgi:hypothetical protein
MSAYREAIALCRRESSDAASLTSTRIEASLDLPAEETIIDSQKGSDSVCREAR